MCGSEVRIVALVEEIHHDAVHQDDTYECNDATLLGNPESEGEAGTGDGEVVQEVGKEDSTPESTYGPQEQKRRHYNEVDAPIFAPDVSDRLVGGH